MDNNILSWDIPDLHSYLRWNSISRYIDYSLFTLDVGCNIGTMTIEIAKRTTNPVVGIDIDSKTIENAVLRAQKFHLNNCHFQIGSAVKLPFEDNTFQQILLADILEHCIDDLTVIEECYRVLKPNGKLIINVPRPNYSNLFNPEWIKQIGHVRDGYELSDIAKLTANYFEIVDFDFNTRAEAEIDDFYNKGRTEITYERVENIIKAEDSTKEPYGITIKTEKRSNILQKDNKPKILHVGWGHPPDLGAGPIYYLHNLCLVQQSKNYMTSCFVANNDQGNNTDYPSIEKIVYEGIVYHTVKNRHSHYFNWENPELEINDTAIEQLFQNILLEETPDIVHFHNLVGLSMSLVKAAKNYGAATIFSIHNYWMLCTRDDLFASNEEPCPGPKDGARCASCVNKNEKVEEFINRISYSRNILNHHTDLILAVSNRVKQILVNNEINSKKIVVNHIGSKVAESNWNLFKSNDIDEKNIKPKIVFGFLGTLIVRKGVHVLIEAIKHLSEYENRFRVDIHGYCPPGSYERRLNLLIDSNEFLKSHISLKGGYRQKDIPEISDQIDIAVVSSIWEDNAPQTVMEMLSADKPVISANIGGIPDFVKDNINGLLYVADSALDLSSKMKMIIENPDLIRELEKGIRPPITMSEHVERLKTYYEMFEDIYSKNKSRKNFEINKNKKNPTNNILYQGNSLGTVVDTVHENELLLESEELIAKNKYSEASMKLNLILQYDINNVNALNELSVINILQNNFNNAEKLINSILEKDPTNEIALENKSYLYSVKKENLQEDFEIKKFTSQNEYRQYLARSENELRERHVYEMSFVKDTKEFNYLGRCIVCNEESNFKIDYMFADEINGVKIPCWRERIICPKCNMNNRMRAFIHLVEKELAPPMNSNIYITEQTTSLFKYFTRKYKYVTGSEYLSDQVAFGSVNTDGIRNEDVTALSFPSNEFNYIFSLEVFEHVPDFPKAFNEIYRVLKLGGKIIFSVPFAKNSSENIIRAIKENDTVKYILPPEYHGDPLNPQGCLCFQYFGWEVIDNLKKASFKDVNAYSIYSRRYGYLGGEDMFFVATK